VPTLALVGDSLLSEIGRDRTAAIEAELPGWVVLNCATSGFTAAHVVRQVEHLTRLAPSAILVSLGTNDASPLRGIEVADFEHDLRTVLDAFPAARRLVLLPPGVDDARRAPDEPRSGEAVDRFRAAADRVATRADAVPVDGPALVATVLERGDDPYQPDGIHLTDPMYDELAVELGRRLR
jgi:lysophospholipase L1-like esterase